MAVTTDTSPAAAVMRPFTVEIPETEIDGTACAHRRNSFP